MRRYATIGLILLAFVLAVAGTGCAKKAQAKATIHYFYNPN